MAEALSPLTFFPVSIETLRCLHILTFKMALVLHCSHQSEIYKQSQNTRKIQLHLHLLALSLEYNSKIAVREFIFHCTINPSANLNQQFTQIR